MLGREIGSTKADVKKGDVLLCKINPRINRVWIVSKHTDRALLASSEWIIIRNEKIQSDYLMCCFRSPYFRQYMLSNVSGVGGSLMRAQPKFVSKYPVPIPPFPEQQRIVDRIERLFDKLDEAKEKAQAVVDGFEDRKAAILHQAFTGELTAEWRRINNVSSGSWTYEPLENVFTIKSGTTIPTDEEKESGIIPYIKVADMNIPGNEVCIVTSSRFVDSCPIRQIIPKGSTIFPKRGGAILTNKKRYVEVSRIIADLNVMGIIPKQEYIDGWYGYYWMLSIDLREINNGSNVPQINNKDMVKLLVPTPSINEQKKIVSVLKQWFLKETQAKEAAEQVTSQIDTMKKAILARAFRGELGTNDPTEPPADIGIS